MSYKEPKAWMEWEGRVFTQVGQGLELLGADDPRYVKYSKSFSRAWLKNGDTFEVIVKVNRTTEEVVATGEAKCGPSEVQPLYIKARIEQPCGKAPIDPALEAEIL